MARADAEARADAVFSPAASRARDMDLGQIYRAHAATVSRWTRRMLGPAGGDVEDLLHEVFLVAQRKLPGFRGDAQVTTWLYAITVRVVQDHRRRRRWRRWLGRDREPFPELAAEGPGPFEQMESRRAAALVYEVLDALPERDRTLLILFEMEGLPGEEIAAITGLSLGNVWVRLHRARARFLRVFIERQERSRKRELR